MSKETDKLIRWQVMYMLAGSTVANTVLISRAIGLEINRTRRLLDGMVKDGILCKEQSTFWNGVHYAKRNYYWLKSKK